MEQPNPQPVLGAHAATQLRPAGRVSDELGGASEIVAAIDELDAAGHGAGADPPLTELDAADATTAIDQRMQALHTLRRAGRGADTTRFAALATQLGHARAAVREAQLLDGAQVVAGIRDAITMLRSATGIPDLVELAPARIDALGFRRCMLSRVRGRQWTASSCYVRDDPALAAAILDTGSGHARVLDHRLVESEIVRRGSAVRVQHAQEHERVDPDFKRVTSTTSYIAAPIIAGGEVLGFVHADDPVDDHELGPFDELLVSTFADCIGCVLERLHYQEQLRRIRRQVEGAQSSVPSLLDEAIRSTGAGIAPARPADPPGERYQPDFDRLTRREAEVLRHMAAGESNSRIAQRLFLSEATVKSHVKHILRKLGAANRAEAVSRYLRPR